MYILLALNWAFLHLNEEFVRSCASKWVDVHIAIGRQPHQRLLDGKHLYLIPAIYKEPWSLEGHCFTIMKKLQIQLHNDLQIKA